MKFAYDSRHAPPFPVIRIVLGNRAGNRRTEPVTALLDTGSDGCLVPMDLLWQVRAEPISMARIHSHWGEARQVELFVVDVALDGLVLPGVVVVGDEEGDDVILGRNVLNKLRLLLDGPAATSTIQGV